MIAVPEEKYVKLGSNAYSYCANSYKQCSNSLTLFLLPGFTIAAAPSMPGTPSSPPAFPEVAHHSLLEDAIAIAIGVILISVGIAFFTSAGLLTGGTAGLAFLLHYATGWGFGKVFFGERPVSPS